MRSLLLLGMLPFLLGAGTDLRLVVHRADALGELQKTTAWLEAQLVRANAQLAPAGIRLHLEQRSSAEVPLEVVSRRDRHALAAHAPLDGDLHLILVKRLANIDGKGDICGVHWRYRGATRAFKGRHYVVLSLPDALPDTMAHELGHYFGLAHRKQPENLMTSPGRAEKSSLEPWQLRRVEAELRAALRTRLLRQSPADLK